jgi:hypothetical protein
MVAMCYMFVCARSLPAQQELVLDHTGPTVTLGLPQPLAEATMSSVPAWSPIKRVDRKRVKDSPSKSAEILLDAAYPQGKTQLTSGPSLAELALPPELVGAVGATPSPPVIKRGTETMQLRSLPAPPQASQETIDSQPTLQSRPRGVDPLDALPPEVVRAVPVPAPPPSNLQGTGSPVQPLMGPPVQPEAPASQNGFEGALPKRPMDVPGGALPSDQPTDPTKTGETKKPTGPMFYSVAEQQSPPCIDGQAWLAPYHPGVFSPAPISPFPTDAYAELSPYRGKSPVPVQRPWVELWRPLYTSGIYPPAKDWFGRYNLVMPHFMVYGDYRTGIGINRNAAGDINNWAQRLNLDMDLEITATERLHAFMGPLDRNGDFTRFDFTDSAEFLTRTDMRLENLFFEGDAGAIWGGWTDQNAPFDLPFSFGLMPVFYQNGVWAADNVMGAAFALPAKNSPWLNWSNYDATFFWASDQINTDAFQGDNNAAEFFGTAWFIEAYDGYIEADYAFVHDDVGGHRSYHNLSVAYTRRYFHRVSNAVRYITNFGQSLPSDERTADGHMLLVENSLISKTPNTLVPYLNFFYGQGRTQSLARANVAGGILNNTGINFETDGLTGYPTLDATGVNASGAALGVNLLGADFQHQLILEAAALSAIGQPQLRNAPGDQYAVGMRYQKPLSNAWIFRTDHMVGLRENAQDLRGSRVELRWKF